MQLSASENGVYLQTFNYYDINLIWPSIAEKFSAIAETTRGRYSTNDILQEITENKQQIWLAREMHDDSIVMVCTTEIRQYPNIKTLFISDLAGDSWQRWLWVLRHMEAFGKEQGCEMAELEGRKGWKKILKDYREEKIILSKKL